MLRPRPSEWSLAEWIWYSIAVVFFSIGIVTGLGEWVFHGWHDPWDLGSPVSLAMGAFSVAWGASSRQMRAFRRENQVLHRTLVARQDQLITGQAEQTAMLREMKAGQAEQTALLREVVASFRAR